MKIVSLILWLIVFAADTISACMGNDPNWILVYCPLTIVIFRHIADVIDEYT